MTDDTGFGVPSTFGGVIPTPNLDRMPDGSLSVFVGRHGAMNPAGRVRIRNIMPIARDYSRASQSFLFARLTRAKHDFIPRTLVFGRVSGRTS
jgi:hypothetical protein